MNRRNQKPRLTNEPFVIRPVDTKKQKNMRKIEDLHEQRKLAREIAGVGYE